MNIEDLIEIKTEEQLMSESINSLAAQNSRITNWNIGGVFRSLLSLFNRGISELYNLIGLILPMLFLHTAKGIWLDLKAAELGVTRKSATKTTGMVSFSRVLQENKNITIPKGTVIKTQPDINGFELAYITTEVGVLPANLSIVQLPVIAEAEGLKYNVGTGMITRIITFIAGIDAVSNGTGWITKEGTDVEEDEPLRQRAILKWEQLSGYTADYYKSLSLEVNGVGQVIIDDQHPRGQGTVDVYITSVSGVPSQELIVAVQSHVDSRKYQGDDVLIKAPATLAINVSAALYVHPSRGDLEVICAEAQNIIETMFVQSSGLEILKVLYGVSSVNRAIFISNLMRIENMVNVNLLSPAIDTPLLTGQMPVKGTVSITVERAG